MEWSEIEKEFAIIDDKCTSKARSKNHDYGNAWMCWRISTLLEVIDAKILRAINLNDIGEEKALVPDKIMDELIDTINYCRFTLMKLEGRA